MSRATMYAAPSRYAAGMDETRAIIARNEAELRAVEAMLEKAEPGSIAWHNLTKARETVADFIKVMNGRLDTQRWAMREARAEQGRDSRQEGSRISGD